MSALTIRVETTTGRIKFGNTDVLKLGDNAVPTELYFTTSSNAARRSEDAAIVFTVKRKGHFSEAPLIRCTSWTRPDSDDDPYTADLDLSDTDETIAGYIGDEDALECVGEIKLTEGSDVMFSEFRPLPIVNSVNRSTDTDEEEEDLTFATSAVTWGNSSITFADTTYTP